MLRNLVSATEQIYFYILPLGGGDKKRNEVVMFD